jgi:Nif-specific regulatory protein
VTIAFPSKRIHDKIYSERKLFLTLEDRMDKYERQGVVSALSLKERHFDALRDLISRDYLARAEWEQTLSEFAAVLGAVLQADFGIVALWDQESGWTCYEGSGIYDQDSVDARGSLSVLNRVRETSEPVIELEDLSQTKSIQRNRVMSMMAVPIHFWDFGSEQPERVLAGCLYAHRSRSGKRILQLRPFEPSDVDILHDIARIAEPTLNLLRVLERTRSELRDSQRRVAALEARQSSDVCRLGAYETRDPWFAQRVLEPLRRVSSAHRVSILFEGPTGAGKSFLAESFHRECVRKGGPFVVLDAAQVTSVETLSAELFGYAPDSGYVNSPKGGRPGKAELADGGTLFIDEIGTLPIAIQQHLLRLVEKGTLTRLGANKEITVDIQLMSATNEDLRTMVNSGRFREDLYWRITDVVITLPHLEDRLADVPYLAKNFLRTASLRACGDEEAYSLTEAAIKKLMGHPWCRAGNIRGLERSILRSVLLAPEGIEVLDAEHLALQELGPPTTEEHSSQPQRKMQLPRNRKSDDELERVVDAVRRCGYATVAAKELGISYRQLTWKLHKYGLSVRDVLSADHP